MYSELYGSYLASSGWYYIPVVLVPGTKINGTATGTYFLELGTSYFNRFFSTTTGSDLRRANCSFPISTRYSSQDKYCSWLSHEYWRAVTHCILVSFFPPIAKVPSSLRFLPKNKFAIIFMDPLLTSKRPLSWRSYQQICCWLVAWYWAWPHLEWRNISLWWIQCMSHDTWWFTGCISTGRTNDELVWVTSMLMI